MAIDAGKVAEGGQDVAPEQSQDASPQSQEQRSGGIGDWFRNTFLGGGGGSQDDGTDDGASEDGSEQAGTDAATPPADGPITFNSRAEYEREVARQAQSLKDRELARERQRNETRAQRAERLRLARDEPYKLADEEIARIEAAEQAESYQAQFVQSLTPVLQLVDAEVVGAVVQALPDAAREKLWADMPADLAGLAQRRHIVTSGLTALEKHWKAEGAADAERRLRSNGTIVKQVLAEQRETAEEPDLIPAAGVPRRVDMDSILRAAAGVH